MLERVLLLVLDRFLEGADVLAIHDLDGEDVTGIIAQNQAIELECERHRSGQTRACHVSFVAIFSLSR